MVLENVKENLLHILNLLNLTSPLEAHPVLLLTYSFEILQVYKAKLIYSSLYFYFGLVLFSMASFGAHFEPLLALLLQNKAYCRATQFWLVSELGVWEARAGVSAHGLMKQGDV